MIAKVKVLCVLVLSGLLLGLSPTARVYSVDAAPAGSSGSAHVEGASVQFVLVQLHRETLEKLTDGSKVPTLDTISIEKLGRFLRAEDGAVIVSQTKLTILDRHESQMTVVENERHKAKNADEGNSEQSRRETEVFVKIRAEIRDANTLSAEFGYKRSVGEELFNTGQKTEEEDGGEQKFDISSGIVLHAGQACIAGANLDGDVATLLIMKAEIG